MSQADFLFFFSFYIIKKPKENSFMHIFTTQLPVNNKWIFGALLNKKSFPSWVHWKSLWPSVNWSGFALHPSGSKARALCLCPFTSPPAAIISIFLQPGRTAQRQHTNKQVMHHQKIFKADTFYSVNNILTKRLNTSIYAYTHMKLTEM